jgi:hypothetical protein
VTQFHFDPATYLDMMCEEIPAGLTATIVWTERDLAVIVADRLE